MVMSLPPLDCLRFFEAAARYQNFSLAARELKVTAASVTLRIRALENHLGTQLFERGHRPVRLNRRGKTYFADVQRILAELHEVTQRHRPGPRGSRIKIVSVETVADRWLMPRLTDFKANHPDIAIELETNHRGINPERRDFDAWIAYTGATAAPRPVVRTEEVLHEETLYEEELLPVCSPAMLAAYGRPRRPADLRDWPLLYDLGWSADWSYWCNRQGAPSPDLSQASGFRLYSLLVRAAVHGLGAVVGRAMLIAPELERGDLVPLFERQSDAPERCCLITTTAALHRPDVRAFRRWILPNLDPVGPPGGNGIRRVPRA